ncbi:hypothetical protein FRACYDRAFT_187896 [Fragilariopsis cylindrus CCMP1102]|uniref:Uncharacterized protein n=1 Tax=Fragilariopsis cylindrus CCMP1102 TaxID=635003 RepID=A0A1E7F8Y7_9STRA|nr:hypothetical protein FRACYDRAFT_187896 [Fragilariopsis cylindrus CCMP1102]|eukprot:OEU14599.1 hypothetical protein FRACYDRAFT_187896 [Fragilariopsis cylindrus CCMP1102]
MRGSRGGFWTEAEDKIIFEAVANESSNYDTTNATGATWKKEHATWKKQQPFRKGFWTTLSKRLNGRDSKQTRDRWFGILNPIINHRPKKTSWTDEEDIILFENQQILGNNWVDIQKLLPGRSRIETKNRYYSQIRARSRRLKREYAKTIALNLK